VRVTGAGQNIDTEDAQYVDPTQDETIRTAHLLEPHDNRFLMSNIALRGATPYGELEATVSALSHRIDDVVDTTGAFTSLGVGTYAVTSEVLRDDIRILNQDIRLHGVAGHFPWSLGAFFSEVEKTSKSHVSYDQGDTELYATRRREEIYEYAVYGDVTWPVATWLDISAGGRVFLIDTIARIQRSEPLLGIADETRGDVRDEGIAPRISLSFKPRAGMTLFASVSAGYRPGGLNATGRVYSTDHACYSADELWNYEIGVKALLANDHLSLRAATFAQTWENVQTDQLIDNGFAYTGNVGDARNLGFEAEAQLTDVFQSDFAINFTAIDPEIVSPSAALRVAADALPGAPHLMVGGSFSHEWGRIMGYSIRSHLAGQFIGQANTSFTGNAATQTDDYTVVNLSLQLKKEGWTWDIYANNIFDAEAATFAYSSLGQAGASSNITRLDPLVIGLRLKRDF
jgi:iron complex outermembrane recepter protein